MNITLPKPSIKLNKTVLLVIAGAVIVLAAICYGIVRQEQYNRAVAATQALQARQDELRRITAADAFKQSQASLNAATAKADAACSLLKQYASNVKTAKLVAYPPVCNVQ